MSNKTSEIPGLMKTIRAIQPLHYKGREIAGRRRTTIEGKLGAYEVVVTEGETAEVDQVFAKEVCMSGKAEILAGGMCEIVVEKDGYHRISDWRPQFKSERPDFERVEYLTGGGMGGFLHWPAGFKCRLDLSMLDRSLFCYQDETPNQYHQIRVLKPSPKRVKMDAAEMSHRVGLLWQKAYPDTPTAAA